MAKIRKIKPKKIKKEFIESRFKEVKSEDNLIKTGEEAEQERNNGEFLDEAGETRRTAPVLQQEERTQEISLEDTVGRAPPVREEQDDLYVARKATAEKGYGQEDYAGRNYNVERKEEARPTLFLDAAREARENIIRNPAVTRQETQDVRIPESWRGTDIREPVGMKDYENIEERAREATKLTKERQARRRVD